MGRYHGGVHHPASGGVPAGLRGPDGVYFRYFHGGLISMPMNLLPTELLSLMCAAMLHAKKRFRGGGIGSRR